MRLMTNTPLDKLLSGGIETDAITNVYGPAGCGKTNIALCATIVCAEERKTVYIDTEGSFSLDRFKQLGGNENHLKNIIFMEPHAWKEQHALVQKLEAVVKKEDAGLIVIDSLVALYRLELDNENFQLINKQLATQYSILSMICRKYKIPVLVTNQVYGFGKDEQVELTSRAIAKYWSKALIELKKLDKPGSRVAIVRKHRSIAEGKSIEFEITEAKLKEVRLGLF
ncbi:MAG: DNA repair and recombination protein RadB [Candidatus Aenigmarchaeota archaeon]|nr:DNA repair and recombination protein RadB [Candidatus Aenigmarchaeota archaeon]